MWRHWFRECGFITLRGWGRWRRGWRKSKTNCWRRITFWYTFWHAGPIKFCDVIRVNFLVPMLDPRCIFCYFIVVVSFCNISFCNIIVCNISFCNFIVSFRNISFCNISL